jgi:hypothetical protein
MGGAGSGCVVYFFFSQIIFLTITTTTTEGQGNSAVTSQKAHLGRVVLVTVVDAPLLALVLQSLSLLSTWPFPLPSLFLSPSLLPPLSFLPLTLLVDCCLCRFHHQRHCHRHRRHRCRRRCHRCHCHCRHHNDITTAADNTALVTALVTALALATATAFTIAITATVAVVIATMSGRQAWLARC